MKVMVTFEIDSAEALHRSIIERARVLGQLEAYERHIADCNITNPGPIDLGFAGIEWILQTNIGKEGNGFELINIGGSGR
ncbi:hypothetical protein [Bradyrhizobium sp. AZCC 1721]|uniref:hypothetical protein n=1 Tax=Bradyrhizobium sp. AZCC 1721 TaxID=3117016 RepID=UPI002FEEB800